MLISASSSNSCVCAVSFCSRPRRCQTLPPLVNSYTGKWTTTATSRFSLPVVSGRGLPATLLPTPVSSVKASLRSAPPPPPPSSSPPVSSSSKSDVLRKSKLSRALSTVLQTHHFLLQVLQLAASLSQRLQPHQQALQCLLHTDAATTTITTTMNALLPGPALNTSALGLRRLNTTTLGPLTPLHVSLRTSWRVRLPAASSVSSSRGLSSRCSAWCRNTSSGATTTAAATPWDPEIPDPPDPLPVPVPVLVPEEEVVAALSSVSGGVTVISGLDGPAVALSGAWPAAVGAGLALRVGVETETEADVEVVSEKVTSRLSLMVPRSLTSTATTWGMAVNSSLVSQITEPTRMSVMRGMKTISSPSQLWREFTSILPFSFQRWRP
ncbi:hypothetical protein CRUP_037011 [Coryphaenoides rupestris]|nr:hypothetical protein CRUP_037011 [Coryphaenoides rupestris]